MTAFECNLDLTHLPPRCEVLVVGAGPAGSACAGWLAQAGREVWLVDAQAFPRDKICGDGLVPDAHAALRRLGVHEAVMQQAHTVTHARCVAPNDRFVDVHGEMAVLPRRQLDAILCAAAVANGARMVAPARFVATLERNGQAAGALFRQGAQQRSVHAQWTVLATGANAPALQAAGVCQRRAPTGAALRAYVHHDALAKEITGLRFFWHRDLHGGYGWIFPGPEGIFNIGTGGLNRSSTAASARSQTNLRRMFEAFVCHDPIAARLMREGQITGALKGAPLRCDLTGALWSRPGLLVAGDAAGSTYSFTGEGIGKALETGIAAAQAILDASADGVQAVTEHYEAHLRALQPRFATYRQAGNFNRHSWLVNLFIGRAAGSARLQSKLSDILNERHLPSNQLSWRGVRNILLP